MKDTSKRGCDELISTLTNQMVNGQLKPGERLPSEGKLCETFKVSRTVVREAIQHLKAIGALETIVGSGSYVTEGNLKSMKDSLQFYSMMTGDAGAWVDMLELRILIEVECVRKLASAGRLSKDKLKVALDEMATVKDDFDAYASADVAFHRVIVETSQNKLYVVVLSSLARMQRRFSTEVYHDDPAEIMVARGFAEHEEIYKAVEAGDAALAEKTMREHLEGARRNLRRYMERRGK